MKTFILLSAVPGSGKSTWAKKYASEHPNTQIVSSDEIRRVHFGAINNFEHEKEVWEIFLHDIHEHGKSENITVIADSTNLTNHFREYYAAQTKEFDHKILVLFQVPYEICCKQNKMRAANGIVPDDAMERLHKEFEKPSQKVIDLYNEFLIVSKNLISDELKVEKIK